MNNTMKKLEDLLAGNDKLAELLHLKKEEIEVKKKANPFLVILAVVGAVAAIAGIAFAVYHFVCPKYLSDDELEEEYESSDEEDFEKEEK